MESIGHQIVEWWQSAFSADERKWMVATYSPLTMTVTSVDEAVDVEVCNPLERHLSGIRIDDAFYRLSGLATWFSKPGYAYIAIAVAEKALQYVGHSKPILDRHFGLQNQCVVLYRWRDGIKGALEAAIATCESAIMVHEQAAIEAKEFFGFIPAHHCFRQLRIIEEKRGNYDRAIELCEMAKTGGWTDDWDKDIARLRRKKDRDV